MESFVRDLRYAQRMLISRPGFTALAVICLALGIGASAAIFSVVNGGLLKPLPYTHAERLAAGGTTRGTPAVGHLPGPAAGAMRGGVEQTRRQLSMASGGYEGRTI